MLMGGQACVFYGAAEFSRDTDFAFLPDPDNLSKLDRALKDLQAKPIAVPPLKLDFLKGGHAIHFRCFHPEAYRIRIDIMSKMRGVDPFPKLWKRRTSLTLPDGVTCELLSLPDLVQAKKTQRDKDWPMIRRLMEAHYFQNRAKPNPDRNRFWFHELRTPELLLELAAKHPMICRRESTKRSLLQHALSGDSSALEDALADEERQEREKDRIYWAPLRKELEELRHSC